MLPADESHGRVSLTGLPMMFRTLSGESWSELSKYSPMKTLVLVVAVHVQRLYH